MLAFILVTICVGELAGTLMLLIVGSKLCILVAFLGVQLELLQRCDHTCRLLDGLSTFSFFAKLVKVLKIAKDFISLLCGVFNVAASIPLISIIHLRHLVAALIRRVNVVRGHSMHNYGGVAMENLSPLRLALLTGAVAAYSSSDDHSQGE